MKHITRAGLGFIGGFFALFGGAIMKEGLNSQSIILGVISISLGIGLFYYGYKG